MGKELNTILEWTKQHPQVDVRIRWSDSLSRYRVEVSTTDRHMSMIIEPEFLEAFPEKILDEMLLSISHLTFQSQPRTE